MPGPPCVKPTLIVDTIVADLQHLSGGMAGCSAIDTPARAVFRCQPVPIRSRGSAVTDEHEDVDDDEDEEGMGFVMPFVVVESNGGDLDDEAFTLGWECAMLADMIEEVSSMGVATFSRFVHAKLVKQVDLIAMANGMRVAAATAWDEAPDEWAYITITNIPEDEDDFDPDEGVEEDTID